MKQLLKSILIGLLTFSIFYLIGVFVQLSFNIFYWTEIARLLVGVIGGTLSILFTIFHYSIQD